MNEYEKMISGRMYNATDPQLTKMRRDARALLDQINGSAQDIRDGDRLALCHALFGSVGSNVWLQPPFYCDYGCNITLGDHVFINFNCVFLDVTKLTIGSAVQIGPNVQIYTAAHPLDAQRRKSGEEYGEPVTIEDDVWIGGGVVICPGVRIGARSVIGAGTVVTRDVPPDVVVAGHPGRILKAL